MKQTLIRYCNLAIILLLFVSTANSMAQLSGIAIVNLVDTTLIHTHIGTTAFTNKDDTFDCHFNCKKYIDQELPRFLSSSYKVGLITIPDSLISTNGSIYNAWGVKKAVKLWVASLKDQYDFIVFVEAREQKDWMNQTNQTLYSSGLYSRGNPIKSWAAAYSTMLFTAFRTSNLKKLDYGFGGMSYMVPLKDYKFPKEKIRIDPEMLPIVKAGLIKMLDYKIEYFLTNSFLVPKDAYDKIKLVKIE